MRIHLNAKTKTLPVDPDRFSDPLAMTVGWTPLGQVHRAIHSTHDLFIRSDDRLEFVGRRGLIAGWFALTMLGVSMAAASYLTPSTHRITSLLMVLVSLVSLLQGLRSLRGILTPAIFDKTVGLFWRFRGELRRGDEGIFPDRRCKIREIHAIQLLPVLYFATNHTIRYHELNLVLASGRRLAVCTAKPSHAVTNARTLADFLGVPLWDATPVLEPRKVHDA
jgi:hypothetical protein